MSSYFERPSKTELMTGVANKRGNRHAYVVAARIMHAVTASKSGNREACAITARITYAVINREQAG